MNIILLSRYSALRVCFLIKDVLQTKSEAEHYCSAVLNELLTECVTVALINTAGVI